MSVIKNNGPIMDPALCRCCRAIKKCRVLTAEYTWMEKKEVYADMIMDCFGILLSHVDGNERDSGVCATCVVRLRDACAFRLQVLQCEELFLHAKLDDKDAEDVKKSVEMELKAEPKDDVSEHSGAPDLDDGLSVDYSADDTQVHNIVADMKLPKPEPRARGSGSDSDAPLQRRRKKKHGEKKKKAVKKQKPGTSKTEKALKVTKKTPMEKRNNYDRDLDCMSDENLLTIIQYSYVCPFKNRRNNYYCFYCKDYYPKPEDLREHTLSHDTKPFQLLMGYKKMPKLDITRIDCRLCPMKINDLNVFKEHIDQVHGKKIYFEAPDKMLLYRLTWNDLVCVMCNDVFEDFNTLNTHMVEHFSNFTCDICGVCFLEKPRLDAHLKRHNDDERHTCEICGKVFKSNHYKDMHVDVVHKKKAIIRCPRCDECFMSYALKNKHLTEAHGQKRTYPCNLCDKVYNRQKTLTEHQRRNHQKVLKHQCEYCDQRFYLPSRLKEHMATHTGERNFRCEHCDKSYPRLKSLQYHIRTHTNDRRYRCHICGQAFIQNTSLKSHIKSHHPECDIDGCYF
ncbi:PR domain zinc finger protein 5-like isoform X2 [Plodia interpunctella]|uniref:PR domain zinc finger protein 5-like isoform X2 n=1 Tax=Plodia interpunctella TaxID=58824 RepID=UPI002367E0F3|nr:PR domain zinc finger protein 5-like isoform X2 [Plodia interpunctella]